MAKKTIIASDVLNRLSIHLDVLSGKIFEVEEALGDHLMSDARNEGLPITKFQSLDFTRQSLEDCALLLNFLSQNQATNTPLGEDRDLLLENLKLDATRCLVWPDREFSSSNVGEIDLF